MKSQPPTRGGFKHSFESTSPVDIIPNQNDKFCMINAPESTLNPSPIKQKRRGKFTLAEVDAMTATCTRRSAGDFLQHDGKLAGGKARFFLQCQQRADFSRRFGNGQK